jgi:hypothetical protein
LSVPQRQQIDELRVVRSGDTHTRVARLAVGEALAADPDADAHDPRRGRAAAAAAAASTGAAACT